MRTVGVVTMGRADYGIYRAVLRRISAHSSLRLWLYVGGTHLEKGQGLTVREVEADGYKIQARIPMGLSDDSPRGIACAIAKGISGFSKAFERSRPDLLLVLGDRYDMFTAPVAALPFRLPVAHLHGGEVTEGAIDDSLRHAITKLSHLHFVATEVYRQRVLQLGEESWRVLLSGGPALDEIRVLPRLSKSRLESTFSLDLSEPPLLVTFHPVTLEYEQASWQIKELLAALEEIGRPCVFTLPNADTGNRVVAGHIRNFIRRNARSRLVESFGAEAYYSIMEEAAAMVGNSSSGITEASSFKLPVVNIGTRQNGRIRTANVVDVANGRESILSGLRQVLDPTFCRRLRYLRNPYGDGHAAERIVRRLAEVDLDDRLLRKRFAEIARTRERNK